MAQPEAPYVLLNLLAWHIAGPEPSLDVPALRGRDLVDPEPGRQIQRVVLAENR